MLALAAHDIEVFAPVDQLVIGEKLDSCGRIILGSLAISVVGDRGSRGKRGCEFGSVRRDEIPWQQI